MKNFKNRYIIIMLLMTSCSGEFGDVIDRKLKMSYDDYEKNLIAQQKIHNEKKIASKKSRIKLPKFTKMLSQPKAPMVGTEKLVSISVTEDVSLKDTFVELGRLANIDMEIDPRISGGVILRVKNKPLSEVIDRLARLGKLRYGTKNGVLFVEKDTAYIEDYKLDFINVIRSNKSDSSVNTSISSSSEGTSGGSTSNNTITSSYEGDLWKSVETNIKQILSYSTDSTSTNNLTTLADSSVSNVAINKQAGILSVAANSRQHGEIRSYLNDVKKSVSSQVLIEAKIVEVSLSDEYRTGINWNFLDLGNRLGLTSAFDNEFVDNKLSIGSYNRNSVGQGLDKSNLKGLVEMMQMFGTTRTISSPRLHAMNNQQSVLSFVQNKVYFKVTIESDEGEETTTTDGSSTTGTSTPSMTLTSELNTVPIGIILSLQPSIDIEANEITMNIRPSLSKESGTVNDPAVAYLANRVTDGSDISSAVPIVEVKEIDSVLKIKSGEVMVIGGLMEERSTNEDNGVPGISQIAGVGNLFKNVTKKNELVQTVIFLKATIVPNDFTPISDRHFYNKFAKPRDSNPWNI